MSDDARNLETIPAGALGLIPLESCKNLGEKVDKYLVDWRATRQNAHKNSMAFQGYKRDTHILNSTVPRFGSGEAKGSLIESTRGMDVYIVCDCFNYGVTFEMYEMQIPMSPDDHFADLKRVIAAISGHAKRITVIMPMLYEGRQHKRAVRESLDCAMALQELKNMGVDNLITFDAHDPRVQNSIPLSSFENIRTSGKIYQRNKYFRLENQI